MHIDKHCDKKLTTITVPLCLKKYRKSTILFPVRLHTPAKRLTHNEASF